MTQSKSLREGDEERPQLSSPVPACDWEALGHAAECLKTLAHPVRLRFVQLLLRGRYTVGELAEETQTPQNVTSEHLRLLQRCGLFTSQREGRRVYYQIKEAHLVPLMNCIEGRFFVAVGR